MKTCDSGIYRNHGELEINATIMIYSYISLNSDSKKKSGETTILIL
jgi:hypothetical protein